MRGHDSEEWSKAKSVPFPSCMSLSLAEVAIIICMASIVRCMSSPWTHEWAVLEKLKQCQVTQPWLCYVRVKWEIQVGLWACVGAACTMVIALLYSPERLRIDILEKQHQVGASCGNQMRLNPLSSYLWVIQDNEQSNTTFLNFCIGMS